MPRRYRHRGRSPRGVADHDLQPVFVSHLAAEAFAVGFGRAIDLQALEPRTHVHEGFHVRMRHAPGTQHTDHLGILLGHVFDADAAVGSDARELSQPVVENGERLSALGVGEQDEPAVGSRPDAVFLLRAGTVIFLLVDDVRLHADGEIAAGRAAFHAAPLVDLAGLLGRDLDIRARLAHCIRGDELAVGLVERVDGGTHREQFCHVRIADDQHEHPTWARTMPKPALCAKAPR